MIEYLQEKKGMMIITHFRRNLVNVLRKTCSLNMIDSYLKTNMEVERNYTSNWQKRSIISSCNVKQIVENMGLSHYVIYNILTAKSNTKNIMCKMSKIRILTNAHKQIEQRTKRECKRSEQQSFLAQFFARLVIITIMIQILKELAVRCNHHQNIWEFKKDQFCIFSAKLTTIIGFNLIPKLRDTIKDNTGSLFVTSTITQVDLVLINSPVYSPDLAPSN